MSDPQAVASLDEQLRDLYRDREILQERFGASGSEEITAMVESLESQLKDFYDRFGGLEGFEDAQSVLMLSRLRELSEALDPMYSSKTVQFFVEDDKPVLRAEWHEAITQGEDR